MTQLFAKLATAAIFDRSMPPERLKVLAVIATFANAGICWPSVETIAKIIGLSRRQVQRHIRELKLARYLTIEPRPGPSQGRWPLTQFRLLYPSPPVDASPEDASPPIDTSPHDASSGEVMRHPGARDASSQGTQCVTGAPSDASPAMSSELDQRTRPENKTSQPHQRAHAREGVLVPLNQRDIDRAEHVLNNILVDARVHGRLHEMAAALRRRSERISARLPNLPKAELGDEDRRVHALILAEQKRAQGRWPEVEAAFLHVIAGIILVGEVRPR